MLCSAGAVNTDSARPLTKAAAAPIGTPLIVTDKSITSVPHNEALKTVRDKKTILANIPKETQ